MQCPLCPIANLITSSTAVLPTQPSSPFLLHLQQQVKADHWAHTCTCLYKQGACTRKHACRKTLLSSCCSAIMQSQAMPGSNRRPPPPSSPSPLAILLPPWQGPFTAMHCAICSSCCCCGCCSFSGLQQQVPQALQISLMLKQELLCPAKCLRSLPR